MDRYARHLSLLELGPRGQSALAGSSMAIVGCGGLGAATAMYLTRAGVGSLTIIDRDVVDEHNLHRQILFSEKDVGRPKAVVAKECLEAIDGGVRIVPYQRSLDPSSIHLLKGVDVIVDGTDNLTTRFLLNDHSVKHKIPWVYGGAVATEGMSATFVPPGPCFRCLFPSMPPPGSLQTCESAGVLGPLPPLVAAIQATEAMKLVTGATPRKTLLYIDPWQGVWREAELEKQRDCPCCVGGEYPYLDLDKKDMVTKLCDGGKVQIVPSKKAKGLVRALEKRYPQGAVRDDMFVLSVNGIELVIFDDGRALVMGAGEEEAKNIYSRFIGW
ncbi:MAG: ThiF family adenylyltransferase [Thermoplasmata archaeon]|nr:ThiF family adenylyltransferase [Thermoplasmata archaeon]